MLGCDFAFIVVAVCIVVGLDCTFRERPGMTCMALQAPLRPFERPRGARGLPSTRDPSRDHYDSDLVMQPMNAIKTRGRALLPIHVLEDLEDEVAWIFWIATIVSL